MVLISEIILTRFALPILIADQIVRVTKKLALYKFIYTKVKDKLHVTPFIDVVLS